LVASCSLMAENGFYKHVPLCTPYKWQSQKVKVNNKNKLKQNLAMHALNLPLQ